MPLYARTRDHAAVGSAHPAMPLAMRPTSPDGESYLGLDDRALWSG